MALKLVGNYVYVVSFAHGGVCIVYAKLEHALAHAKHHTPEDAVVTGYDPDASISVFYYAEWGDGEYVVVQSKLVNERWE